MYQSQKMDAGSAKRCFLSMMTGIALLAALATALDMTPSAASQALQSADLCKIRQGPSYRFVICTVDPARFEIKLFLQDADNRYYHQFDAVKDELAARGQKLYLAMNAGMYHQDRSPVGLFVENGRKLKNANTNEGPGNFHLKPNGVFFIDQNGRPGVQETGAFLKAERNVRFATQSGPMLVIGGKIHPRFIVDSPSRKRRNGVGITKDGKVVFVLADYPVNFHDLASLFRDELKTRDALFLDGTISRIYAPGLGRNDPGRPMGPIIGVVPKPRDAADEAGLEN